MAITTAEKPNRASIRTTRNGLPLWKPGQSGNPNGRRTEISEAKLFAKKEGLARIKDLVCRWSSLSERSKVELAKWLFEQGYGKAVQPSEVSYPQLSDEELRAKLSAAGIVLPERN